MRRAEYVLAAALLALTLTLVRAQTPSLSNETDSDGKEQVELGRAVQEAGNSPVDLIRALERHLEKYPDTKQRAPIEKALAKTAMDANDNARIILYGERLLAREKPDDLQLIDRVTLLLIRTNDPGQIKKGLEYARRYESDVLSRRAEKAPGHLTGAEWSEQLDLANGRALVLQARATGDLGNQVEAAKLAVKSWTAYPAGENAREAAQWYARLEQNREAIEFYAKSFTVADPLTTDEDRAQDRMRMGALYTKLNGSEKGLGDLILTAYDRTSALLSARRSSLKVKDPNAEAAKILDFALTAVDGSPPLRLGSLKGKTVVMDFWATWCVPCRAQHPLIEAVKTQFENAPDVVFLAVNSDEDVSPVEKFIREQGWTGSNYFEGGLVRHFNITTMPTVLILNPNGEVSSRMAGFVPDRFETLLKQRIEDARRAH